MSFIQVTYGNKRYLYSIRLDSSDNIQETVVDDYNNLIISRKAKSGDAWGAKKLLTLHFKGKAVGGNLQYVEEEGAFG